MGMERNYWSIYATLASAYSRARESEEWRLLYDRVREVTTLISLVKNYSRALSGSWARRIDDMLIKISRHLYEAIDSGDIGIAAEWVSKAFDELSIVYSRLRLASFMFNSSRMMISFALILSTIISIQMAENLIVLVTLFLIIGVALDSILLYKTMYPPYMLAVAGTIAVILSAYLFSIGIIAPGLVLAGGLAIVSPLLERSIASSLIG